MVIYFYAATAVVYSAAIANNFWLISISCLKFFTLRAFLDLAPVMYVKSPSNIFSCITLNTDHKSLPLSSGRVGSSN
jgi:hypothetical protein